MSEHQAVTEDRVVAIVSAGPARTFERPSFSALCCSVLGRIVATPGVKDGVALPRITECLLAHARGEWGCLCEEDRRTNDVALARGFRVHSAWPIDPSQPSRGPRREYAVDHHRVGPQPHHRVVAGRVLSVKIRGALRGTAMSNHQGAKYE